jgi:acylphosphatase
MQKTEQKALRFTVYGKVQGVGFRCASQEEARRLGVGGWVVNDVSGCLTGYVQGAPDSVDAFVKWLKKGPKTAKVRKVDFEMAEVEGYRLFTIRS